MGKRQHYTEHAPMHTGVDRHTRDTHTSFVNVRGDAVMPTFASETTVGYANGTLVLFDVGMVTLTGGAHSSKYGTIIYSSRTLCVCVCLCV